MRRRLLNALLYFPSRQFLWTPGDVGLDYTDVDCHTADGGTVHGWWITAAESRGHILFAHGNGGNIGDRVEHARLLVAAGFDVLLFDYRGYGRSRGRPDERSTYADARAARSALLAQEGVDPSRVIYLGESLGGAVVVELATAHPPAGLVLLSTFTSVRDVARVHYPVIPATAVPDVYPSLRRIGSIDCPVLVIHGGRDEIVPVDHARQLFAAAREPKQIEIFPRAGHNDLVIAAGPKWAETIAAWSYHRPHGN